VIDLEHQAGQVHRPTFERAAVHRGLVQTEGVSRMPERNAFDRARFLRRIARPIEVVQVRWFGASAVSIVARTPVLVLHTTGRRSGAERATPLAFHHDGDGRFLIVGGASGQARLPDWVANLRAAPDAAVTVDRRHVQVRAEELGGGERAATWSALTTAWPRIDVYERRAGRPVPVFRLTRR
jgi:deazaflavin-dependent oxidoreductase (nitroreductase family)